MNLKVLESSRKSSWSLKVLEIIPYSPGQYHNDYLFEIGECYIALVMLCI